jgi:hypothetical protein
MDTKAKSRKPVAQNPDQNRPWQVRHENDAGGPLANNNSDQPDRASAIAEGSPGEPLTVHGSGFQQPAGAVHPDFPGGGAVGNDVERLDQEEVRRRAYQLWEDEGRPEGDQERHWLRAEQDVRGNEV